MRMTKRSGSTNTRLYRRRSGTACAYSPSARSPRIAKYGAPVQGSSPRTPGKHFQGKPPPVPKKILHLQKPKKNGDECRQKIKRACKPRIYGDVQNTKPQGEVRCIDDT